MKRKIKVGWQEWISLKDIGIHAIKSKVDTGATTSSLGANKIIEFQKDNETWVNFIVQPIQGSNLKIKCEAKVVDKRIVSDSGGHKNLRYVIKTCIELDGVRWPIEITLAKRNKMKYQMLLGRQAMKGRIIVDPGSSFVCGKLKKSEAISLYQSVNHNSIVNLRFYDKIQ